MVFLRALLLLLLFFILLLLVLKHRAFVSGFLIVSVIYIYIFFYLFLGQNLFCQ